MTHVSVSYTSCTHWNGNVSRYHCVTKCLLEWRKHDPKLSICIVCQFYILSTNNWRGYQFDSGSPTAPLLDLTKPPQLEGNKITAIWTPPTDSGGDPDNLYFDVYAAQLKEGQNPTFCRQNEEQIDKSEGFETNWCWHILISPAHRNIYILEIGAFRLAIYRNSLTDVTTRALMFLAVIIILFQSMHIQVAMQRVQSAGMKSPASNRIVRTPFWSCQETRLPMIQNVSPISRCWALATWWWW